MSYCCLLNPPFRKILQMSFYLHFFKDLLCDVVRYVAMQLDMQLFLFKNKLACILYPCLKSCGREYACIAFPHPSVVKVTGHACQEMLKYRVLSLPQIYPQPLSIQLCSRFLYIHVTLQLQLNNYRLHIFFRPASHIFPGA